MQAILALEDGRIFRGTSFGAAGGVLRRGGLQYIADWLSGDLYRSLLCGSDCGSDESTHWKLWNDAE